MDITSFRSVTTEEILLGAKFPQIIFTDCGGLSASIIKWYSDSNYSHAGFCLGDGLILESVFRGVQKNSILRYLNCNWFILSPKIDFDKMSLDRFKKYVLSKEGYKYNFLGPVAFALKTKRAAQNQMYCSQFVEDGFSYMNFPLIPRKSAEKSTPELLFQSWRLGPIARFNKEKNKLTVF